MSLLDDVSIVVTPNAYKAGTLYGVLPTATESSELITCGDFACADPNAAWTRGTGTTISSGVANITAGSSGGSALSQTGGIFVSGKRFKVTFTISNYSSGSIAVSNISPTTYRSANGTYTLDAIGAGGDFLFFSNGFVGSVDNISVIEVTNSDMDVTRATAATRVDEDGLVNYAEVVSDTELVTNGDFATDSDWTKGPNWTISGGSANSDGTDATSNLYQNTFLSFNGKGFLVEGNASNVTQGFVYISLGGSDLQIVVNSNGAFKHYVNISSGNSILYISGRNNFIGSIDNVSVKQLTRDNVPRIDYTGGGCPHILSEPQRTNFVAYSIPDNTNWSKGSNTTITENFSTSPDGTQNASRLVMPTGSGTYAYYQFTATSTTNHTFSFYAKNNGGDADVTMAFFVASQTQSITLTNEWKRFEFTTSITSGNSVQVGVDNLTSIDMLIWGCQCEESYATSYIPTSGSTVTRNQDIFTRDGIGSLINSTEGVLFAEISALSNDASYRYMGVTDGSSDNRVIILYYQSNNRIRVLLSSGGTKYFDEFYAVTSVEDFHKVAVKWKVNDFALWIDGVERATDTSGSTPIGLNTLALDQAGGDNWFGKVKQLQVYNTALTDEQLLQLTGTSGTDFYESYAEMASALTYTIQ
jgi:hypothetical protein